MESIILYLLKVTLGIALFYALHMLFLRKETFLKLRRAYFGLTLLFSVLYPFVNLNWTVAEKTELLLPAYLLTEVVAWGDNQATVENAIETSSAFSSSGVLIIVMVVGASVLLVKFLIQFASLFLRLRRAEYIKSDGCRLVMVEDECTSSFSFFHWIVVNKTNISTKQIDDIIRHEKAHSHQYHSIDVIAFELACILFWWNPFVWLLRNEVKLNLEYLADEDVQRHQDGAKDYQYTLLQCCVANRDVAFVNNFNVSQLKKRIIMMNKKRTSKIWSSKFLLALPLALTLLLGNVVYANTNAQVDVLQDKDPQKKEVFEVVEQMPSFPGGNAAMMKFIGENLMYPVLAQEAGAKGRVVVKFIVSAEGKVEDVAIVRSNIELTQREKDEEVVVVGYGKQSGETEDAKNKKISQEEATKLLEKEAMRIMEAMPTWEPGKQGGKAAAVYYTLPILFRLKK